MKKIGCLICIAGFGVGAYMLGNNHGYRKGYDSAGKIFTIAIENYGKPRDVVK